MAHHAQQRVCNELYKLQGSSMERQSSSGEEPRSGDDSQAGRGCHRLSRESSSGNPLPLSCRQSLDAPSIGQKASTTITEGLLPSVTESEAPLLHEQEVLLPVPSSAEACAKCVVIAA